MRYEADTYVLSSGRMFYANNGILGLGPDGRLSEGYDGMMEHEDGSVIGNFGPEFRFTTEERAEIADEMIRRWTAWKEKGDG